MIHILSELCRSYWIRRLLWLLQWNSLPPQHWWWLIWSRCSWWTAEDPSVLYQWCLLQWSGWMAPGWPGLHSTGSQSQSSRECSQWWCHWLDWASSRTPPVQWLQMKRTAPHLETEGQLELWKRKTFHTWKTYVLKLAPVVIHLEISFFPTISSLSKRKSTSSTSTHNCEEQFLWWKCYGEDLFDGV